MTAPWQMSDDAPDCTIRRQVSKSPPGFWTEDKLKQAIALKEAGNSAGVIAEKIGAVSRSVVIGKLYRKGIAFDETGKTIRQRLSRASAPKPVRKTTYLPAAPKANPAAKIAPSPVKWKAGDGQEGVPFGDLRPRQCHWPLGPLEKKAEKFCGAPTVGEAVSKRPYCKCHYERSRARQAA